MSPPACPVLPELPELPGAAATGRWRAPRRLAAQALALQGLGLGLTLVAALVASHLQHRTRLADFAGHTRVLSISLQDHLEMAQRDLERLRDLHYRIDLGRDELEIPVKAALDGEYARKMSFLFDVRCFFGTIVSIFKHEGVFEGGTGALASKAKGETEAK